MLVRRVDRAARVGLTGSSFSTGVEKKKKKKREEKKEEEKNRSGKAVIAQRACLSARGDQMGISATGFL